MPFRSFIRFLSALFILTASAHAQENRYDLLGRMLMPFVNIFATDAKTPNRAVSFTLKLEQMTDLPANLVGSQAEVAVQFPDKIRLRAPILGEEVIVCRKGEELWAYPGSKIEAMLTAAAAEKKLPKVNPKFHLEPFSLPVPEKELVFLPVLFQVKDVGSEPLDGVNCRVLDVYLMPELARSLKVQNWGARAWVQPDAKPARITVAKPGWMVAVRFDQLQFATKLPDSTWEPTTEQATDVLKLDPARYQQLLQAIVK